MNLTHQDIISFLQSEIDKASLAITAYESLIRTCKINQDTFLIPSIKKTLNKMRKEQRIRKDIIKHYIMEQTLEIEYQKWLDEQEAWIEKTTVQRFNWSEE